MRDHFALLLESAAVTEGGSGSTVTAAGERFWWLRDGNFQGETWVPGVPQDVRVFPTVAAARRAARTVGSYWYFEPSGRFEVIALEPVYHRVFAGYVRRTLTYCAGK